MIDRSDPSWKSKCYHKLGSSGLGVKRKRCLTVLRNEIMAQGVPADDAYERAFEQIMSADPPELDTILEGDSPEVTRDMAAALHAAAKGKVSSEKVYVRWVNQNLSKPLHKIDIQSVPCDEAVAMLVWARRAPENEDKFFTNIWKSVIVKDDLATSAAKVDAMDDLDEIERALEAVK